MDDLDDLAARLQRFRPFDAYDAEDLLVFASRAHQDRVGPGQTLFHVGDNDLWTFCLVEGTVELVAADGRAITITAGTSAAGKPLSPLKPRLHTARTRGPATLVFLDTSGLSPLHEMARPCKAEMDVDYIDIDVGDGGGHEAAAVPASTREALLGGSLTLPTLPEVALRARRLIDSESSDTARIAAAVGSDPAIAAKLIKAANSPLYRGQTPVSTCETAIQRLGLRSTRALVLAFAMRELFQTGSPALTERMRRIWEHCNEVAAIAFVIARLSDTFEPEEAMLAGLLHDIGVLPVLHRCAQEPALAADPAGIDALVSELRAELGATILQRWNFPPAFITAAREADDWWRDPHPDAELADIIAIAQLHAWIGKPGRPRLPALPSLPAFRRLFPGAVGPELGQCILAEAAAQIAEARGLLAA